MSSSGILSQDKRHWKSSKRPRKTCKNKTLNLRILKIESSSCRCSMILIGREEGIENNVFQISNKSTITRRNSRSVSTQHTTSPSPPRHHATVRTLDFSTSHRLLRTCDHLPNTFVLAQVRCTENVRVICHTIPTRRGSGHSLDLEVNRNGMDTQVTPPEGKWQATVNLMAERFEESGHPVFQSVSPLARGILRKKNNEETIHFTAEPSNTELLSNDSVSKSAHYLRSSCKLV